MYKRGVFSIATKTGKKEVTGMISGNYGYFKVDKEFSPTYLPTGHALPYPIYFNVNTATKAKAIILVYRDFFGDDLPVIDSGNGYYQFTTPVDKERILRDKLRELDF